MFDLNSGTIELNSELRISPKFQESDLPKGFTWKLYEFDYTPNKYCITKCFDAAGRKLEVNLCFVQGIIWEIRLTYFIEDEVNWIGESKTEILGDDRRKELHKSILIDWLGNVAASASWGYVILETNTSRQTSQIMISYK